MVEKEEPEKSTTQSNSRIKVVPNLFHLGFERPSLKETGFITCVRITKPVSLPGGVGAPAIAADLATKDRICKG